MQIRIRVKQHVFCVLVAQLNSRCHTSPTDGKQAGPVVPDESDDSLLDDTEWLEEPENAGGRDGATPLLHARLLMFHIITIWVKANL